MINIRNMIIFGLISIPLISLCAIVGHMDARIFALEHRISKLEIEKK